MAVATQLGGAPGQQDGLKITPNLPSTCVIPQTIWANEKAKPGAMALLFHKFIFLAEELHLCGSPLWCDASQRSVSHTETVKALIYFKRNHRLNRRDVISNKIRPNQSLLRSSFWEFETAYQRTLSWKICSGWKPTSNYIGRCALGLHPLWHGNFHRSNFLCSVCRDQTRVKTWTHWRSAL